RSRRAVHALRDLERERGHEALAVVGTGALAARLGVDMLDLDHVGALPRQAGGERALLVGAQLTLPAGLGLQLELGLGERLAVVDDLEVARLASRHDVK